MEILNTIPGSVDGFGIFFGIVFGLFALFFLIGFFASITTNDVGAAIGCVFFVTVSGLISVFGTKASLEKSPDQYEAVVTDFNEVYNNGYEIVEQRGDIYILTKSEAK